MDLKDEFMTLDEVATLLRCHRTTIYRMVKQREIPAIKLGLIYRFRRDSIDKWLNGKEMAVNDNSQGK